MSFSSPGFIFAFAPVFFLIYFFIPLRARNGFLMLASLTFYSIDGGFITAVLIGSIFVNYVVGGQIERSADGFRRSALLAAGIVVNLIPLFYYKYWNFGLTFVHDAQGLIGSAGPLSLADIILPAGISFFTFQGLSYIIDIYRREIRSAPTVIDFGMYHTLFPQLVAGPIVRYREVENRIVHRPVSLDDVEQGIIRFCVGLAKKIMLADSMGVVADRMFGLPPEQLTTTAAWLGALAYTLQIFFDFSGYSDMAIGLGRMLGFRFPENFNQPYRSRSITEFWRRWHMTLSRWFRDYVYIPLGGNREGWLRTYLHLSEPVHRLRAVRPVARRGLHLPGVGYLPRRPSRRRARQSQFDRPVRPRHCQLAADLAARGDRLGVFSRRHDDPCGSGAASDGRIGPDGGIRRRRLRDARQGRFLRDRLRHRAVAGGTAAVRAGQLVDAHRVEPVAAAIGGAGSVRVFRGPGRGERLQSLHLLPVLMQAMLSRIPFIVVFLILTLLPGLQMITKVLPSTTVNENRALAKAPDASTPIDRLPRVANDWFNDHFGLRSFLIKLKTQVDYSLFRTSDRVLVGRDGWLFYRSTVNVEPAMVETRLAQGKSADIVQGMKLFTEALGKAGIRTVLVVNMMSDRFYADKLPAAAVRRPPHSRIDELVEKLRGLPSLRYVDSYAILRRTMQERPIFHKTDFHWNDPGAFPVAKAVVDTISSAEGWPASAWRHPLEITEVPSSGGIASFMPLFVPPSESALMVKPTYVLPPGSSIAKPIGVYEDVTIAQAGTPGYLPLAAFVGDSFLDGMVRAGLQAPFISTVRARWKPGLKLSKLAEDMPAGVRWCVIEFIEVNFTAMDAFADLDDVAKAVAILERRGS